MIKSNMCVKVSFLINLLFRRGNTYGNSEKHSTTDHTVCLIESVDGAKTVDECGRGASVMRTFPMKQVYVLVCQQWVHNHSI